MHSIPLNVFKPFVRFDVLSVMRIHIAASIVFVLMRCRMWPLYSVSLRTQAIIFLLDDTSYQILTSLANDWLVREAKGRLMMLGAGQMLSVAIA